MIAQNLAPDISDAFRDAMASAGLAYGGQILADGQLHRIKTEGDSRPNSWYVVHADGIPAGAFGSWKSGVTGTWRAESNLTGLDYARQRDRLQAAIRAARRERDRAATVAAAEAGRVWGNAGDPDVTHPYLLNKHVGAHGLRQHGECLLVPVRNVAGDLMSLQRIGPDGSKRFLPGAKVGGGLHLIGEPSAPTIVLCEGYATAASVHQATNYPVVCCFNAGNLPTVAGAFARQMGRYIIAADNDHETPSNPGMNKAREAAQTLAKAVARVRIIAPSPARGVTDWNDIHVQDGIEAVRRAFR